MQSIRCFHTVSTRKFGQMPKAIQHRLLFDHTYTQYAADRSQCFDHAVGYAVNVQNGISVILLAGMTEVRAEIIAGTFR